MGACSSKPKTADFEVNMEFYLQREMETRNTLDNDLKSECIDAGLESVDLNTAAESQWTVDLHPQEAMARKNLEDDLKLTISSRDQRSLQVLQPCMEENEHGSMGDTVFESVEESPVGTGLENIKKEACAKSKGFCDAEHHFVAAEGESLVSEIGLDNAIVQNREKLIVQQLYEDPAFAQNLLVNGAQCRHEEALKDQSVLATQLDTERKDLMVSTSSDGLLAIKKIEFSHIKPPALISLPDAAFSNGSLRVVGINPDEFARIDISPSTLKSTGGKGADKQLHETIMATSMCDELSCRIPNITELHLKCSASTDENLGVPETEKPLNACFNTKVEDKSMAQSLGDKAADKIPSKDGTDVGLNMGSKETFSEAETALDMIPSKDGTSEVGLEKGSKETFFVAETNLSIGKASDSQIASLSEVHQKATHSLEEEIYARKQQYDVISCTDNTRVFQVLNMANQQMIDYKKHSAAASQPFRTFQELRLIYGKDMVSDIDEVLEKLASEFERQESLSTF